MRTIKFRAWDKESKSIIQNFANWGDFQDYMDENSPNNEPARKRYEVMQFTGIIDIHGKEIYESDIVIAYGNGKVNYIVEFRDGAWVFGCDTLYHSRNSIEVIGNLYENNELLTK